MRKIRKSLIVLFFFVFITCINFGVFGVFADNNIQDFHIIIDTFGYDLSGLPKGVEGKSYPVFPSGVYDIEGNHVSNARILVFFDINGDTYNGIVSDDNIIPVSNDRFATESAGTYVIEYTAEYLGTTKVEKVFIQVLPESEYVENHYEINDSIQLSAFTGKKVYLPEGVLTFDKKFGNPDINVRVFLGDYQNKQTRKEVSYIDYGKPYFLPMVSGIYTIEYSIVNILGEEGKFVSTIEINVTDSPEPIMSDPTLSQVAFVGEEIVFPEIEAIQFLDGKAYYLPTDLFVNGNKYANKKFIPTETGDLQVYYSAKSIDGETEGKSSVFTIMVNDLSTKENETFYDDYFRIIGFSTEIVEIAENNKKLHFTAETGDACLSFVNKIPKEILSAKIISLREDQAFDNLKIIFTDSAYLNKKIEIQMCESKEVSDNIEVYINGEYKTSLSNRSFTNREIAEISIVYDYESKGFKITNSVETLIPINSYYDGSYFDGFNSGFVFMAAEVNGIKSNTFIELLEIATNKIKNANRDNTSPIFVNESDLAPKRGEQGDKLIFKKPAVFDLLDKNPKVYIYVTAPDGTVVENYSEIENEYVLDAKLSGNYFIKYRAVDNANNKLEISAKYYTIIADRQSPLVVTMPEIQTEVEVNREIKFEDVEFADNVTKECVTYMYVTFGNYEKQLIKDNKYIFSKKGIYKLVYGAIDGAGNKTEVIYYIKCK